ncbi:MAG: hypothetical protein ABEJ42_10240 [Halobacteriaceae archaeon]
MVSPTAVQLALAGIPLVGAFVLAVDRLSSQRSIGTRTVLKVLALSLIPAVVILGLAGALRSPVIAGLLGLFSGFVLARLVPTD